MSWIKIHKKILKWEWYDDIPVRVTFFHLLLKANWKEKQWKGITIKRGQVLTGSISTPKEIVISRQQFRRAIKVLISNQTITTEPTNRNTLITIVNYDDYQVKEKKTTNKKPPKQPTNNQQITTTKEYKEYKEYKNKEDYILVLDNILLSEIVISDVPEKLKFYFKTAKSFQELFIKNLKDKKSPTTHQDKAKFKSYVDPVRLMFDIDKVEREQLLKVYNFLNSPNSEKGDFSWKVNILSTKKLREKFQQLSAKANTSNKSTNNSQKTFSKNRNS